MERDSQSYYYQVDHLGSVRLITDSTGAEANSYDYEAYGNFASRSETVANPYTYTAREFDIESGLHYYRARTYDSNTGRFISEDPLELGRGELWKILAPEFNLPDAEDPVDLAARDINLYRYTFNNPVNAVDPSGFGPYFSYKNLLISTVQTSLLAGGGTGVLVRLAGGSTCEAIVAGVGIATITGTGIIGIFAAVNQGVLLAVTTAQGVTGAVAIPAFCN